MLLEAGLAACAEMSQDEKNLLFVVIKV